jgi:hypothetical protein
MQEFEGAGFTDDKLVRLNKLRCHQQAVFFSDILDSGGKAIDMKYLKCREQGDAWSTMIFPQESPPVKDFRFWADAIQHIELQGSLKHSLGRFCTLLGHKIWEWRYDAEKETLYNLKGATKDTYAAFQARGNTRQEEDGHYPILMKQNKSSVRYVQSWKRDKK